jgi:hypothetical protein
MRKTPHILLTECSHGRALGIPPPGDGAVSGLKPVPYPPPRQVPINDMYNDWLVVRRHRDRGRIPTDACTHQSRYVHLGVDEI